MNRRDLLRLKGMSGARVFELACEGLYMRYLETRRPSPPIPAMDDHRLGEPDSYCPPASARDLFEGLQHDLAGADLLRVVDPRWLADTELRRAVDDLVAVFRARGGRVEVVTDATAPRRE